MTSHRDDVEFLRHHNVTSLKPLPLKNPAYATARGIPWWGGLGPRWARYFFRVPVVPVLEDQNQKKFQKESTALYFVDL